MAEDAPQEAKPPKTLIERLTGTTAQVTALLVAIAALLAEFPTIKNAAREAFCTFAPCELPPGRHETSSSQNGSTPASKLSQLEAYRQSIASTKDPAEKHSLQISARRHIAQLMNFGTITSDDTKRHEITKYEFISYDPVLNILDFKYYNRSDINRSGSWIAGPERQDNVRFYLDKIDYILIINDEFGNDEFDVANKRKDNL